MSVESKGVEDVIETGKIKVIAGVGATYFVPQNAIVEVFGYDSYTDGTLFQRVSTDITINYPESHWTFLAPNWVLSAGISTSPKHTTLQLDNQSITASKALISQTSEGTQVFTQEIIDGQTDTGEFEQLTNGVLDTGEQTKVLYKASSIKLA